MYQPSKETTLKALGKEWRVGVFGMGAIERFIEWVRGQVGDPFAGLTAEVLQALPAEFAQQRFAEACDRRDALAAMDYDDPLIRKFLGSPTLKADGTVDAEASAKSMNKRGMMHLFHALLKRHHPAVDFDTCCDIVEEIGHEEMAKSIAASQGAMEKNADAPAPSAK